MTAFLVLLRSLSWQTWLCVALSAAGVVVYAEKTGHIKLLEHRLDAMTKDRDSLKAERDAAVELGKKTDAEWRAKEAQTTKDQKEAAIESQRFTIRARDDSASANDALRGLLQRVAARGGQAASDPATSSNSATAEGPGLRTDLLGSVGAEAIRYARIADEARIRGGECASDYDAVAKPIESERGDDDHSTRP